MACARTEGKMFDLGVAIPGEGRMYLCATYCAPQIAAQMGAIETPKPKCSAIKANGDPCSADALPGYEICVAHLRVRQQKEETSAVASV